MPGMPGSLGMFITPPAMITKRARSSSPRLVETRQRWMPAAQPGHEGVEQGPPVEVELVGDDLEVVVDLIAVGELLRRQESGLFQQRQIAVGVVVALQAGI